MGQLLVPCQGQARSWLCLTKGAGLGRALESGKPSGRPCRLSEGPLWGPTHGDQRPSGPSSLGKAQEWLPKDVHAPTPRICAQVTSPAKRND